METFHFKYASIIFLSLFFPVILGCSNHEAMRASPKIVDSYESCVAAGYPLLKSHPAKCITPSGETYIEGVIGSVTTAVDGDSAKPDCVDNCGNGQCEEIVCLATHCPCAETAESCPEDCK